MQSYGLLTFLIFLFEPVENILTVEEKTELVRVALFPQQLQFSILHAEILTGNLQVGGGTVITSIPTLKVGVNATV